jgi:biotin carboxyl carrier protein
VAAGSLVGTNAQTILKGEIMSLYYVTIGNNEYHVNVNGNQAKVVGKTASGSLQKINKSGLHLLHGDKQSLEIFLNSQDEETLEVLVGSKRVIARVETLQRHLKHKSKPIQADTLNAPMPGLIVDVLITEGQQVTKGQTMVILESMKMQMQLKVSCSASIKEIAVRAGEHVDKGALLVRIDSDC